MSVSRLLACEPARIGWGVTASRVKHAYPLFCRALNVTPMPYKDFAKELAEAMPRRRRYAWKGGKRLRPVTCYKVRDPATNVVDLAAAERKQA